MSTLEKILSNNKFWTVYFSIFFLTIPLATSNAAVIESKRLKVKHNVACYVPYASNLPIDKENIKIKHLIIPVYSGGSNVYSSCIKLLDMHRNRQDSIIVVSPQFLTKGQLGKNSEKNLLYWNVKPFYGSSISTTKSFDGDLRISAYTILEDIIADFCTKKTFPNLKKITILGHSAGGQLTNRFAASNTVEFDKARPQNIEIKYIVMNPSSYIYFSPKRSVNFSDSNFAIPTDDQIAKAKGYNNYSYGLNQLYSYHRAKRLTAKKMRQLYPQRKVVYLLGQKDCVQDGSMSTHPFAMIQGRNRLERGRLYYAHLIDEFGPAIKKNQKFRIVNGAGHSGRKMILSKTGRLSILN